MRLPNKDDLEIFAFIFVFFLIVGCAPIHTAVDSKISGNLVKIEISTRGSGQAILLYFEDKTIHTLKIHSETPHFVFKTNRLNEIYYDSYGYITAVKILE